ncbi:MAG TPA: hypothetical protein VFD58_01185 [Blastocatellia bacterium]|nr:hypothetical protein [Blastocatellia bacterium]
MKKATKQATPKPEPAPRDLCEVRAGVRRAVDEFARHPMVRPCDADFLLLIASLCEAPAILSEKDVSDADDLAGYQRIAGAIATLEQYKRLLPPDFYNDLGDWLCELQNRSRWHSDPEMLALIYPLVLRRAQALGPRSWVKGE